MSCLILLAYDVNPILDTSALRELYKYLLRLGGLRIHLPALGFFSTRENPYMCLMKSFIICTVH
jgi:hypothetical protein